MQTLKRIAHNSFALNTAIFIETIMPSRKLYFMASEVENIGVILITNYKAADELIKFPDI